MQNLDTNNGERFYSFKCGISSFSAKYVVAIFHPLDVLKTRLQSIFNSLPYRS